MKIKNIFFAAILVLAGFSCSMEDDAIMNVNPAKRKAIPVKNEK